MLGVRRTPFPTCTPCSCDGGCLGDVELSSEGPFTRRPASYAAPGMDSPVPGGPAGYADDGAPAPRAPAPGTRTRTSIGARPSSSRDSRNAAVAYSNALRLLSAFATVSHS